MHKSEEIAVYYSGSTAAADAGRVHPATLVRCSIKIGILTGNRADFNVSLVKRKKKYRLQEIRATAYCTGK